MSDKSLVRLHSSKLRQLCQQALDGIEPLKERVKEEMIAHQRKLWEKSLWTAIRRFLGMEVFPPDAEELWARTYDGFFGRFRYEAAGNEGRDVAKRLLVATKHAEYVLVSADDLQKIDNLASWAPAPPSLPPYRVAAESHGDTEEDDGFGDASATGPGVTRRRKAVTPLPLPGPPKRGYQ